MATNKLQIWNVALSAHLGAGKLANTTTPSPQQEQCVLHYDDTVRALLEAHWWTWARARTTLTAEATNDRSNEWAYKYRMPGDVLAIRWINEPQTARALMAANRNPDTPRELYGDHVYSDVQSAVMEYTALVEDVSVWPQIFADAVAAALAARMAMPLTENARLRRDALQMAEMELERAIVHDEAMQSGMEQDLKATWLDERGTDGLDYPPVLGAT